MLTVLLLLAACGPSEELTAAKDYLYAMYKDDPQITPADYTVVKSINISGVTYSVTWSATVNGAASDDVKLVEGEGNTVTVDLNEKTEADVSYVLKATISDKDGKTIEQTFERKIPAFKELTYAEYIAAADDDTVVVKGVVTAVMGISKGNTYNCLYFQDADGGYYAYDLTSDPAEAGVLPGMTVRVTGTRDTYSGTVEIASGSFEIIDNNVTDVTAVDYTELYKAAETLKDEALVGKQSILVTVKGVEVTGEDTTSGYYKFKLGELETYVRISSSVCPITKDEQATFKASHAEHLGWTADVTGVVCVYDGAFYLTPVTVGSFEYVSLPVKDDAGMVEFEKGNLSLVASVTENKEIELVTAGKSYDKVSVSWTSDSEFAVVTDGKLVITLPETDAVAKITATLTCGSASDTVEFELKLIASELSYEEIVAAAYALEENASLEGTYRLFGIVSSIDTAYSAEYKNVTVTIVVAGLEEQKIQCFRLKGEGADTIAVGDAITVEGALKNYKGTVEFDSGCTFVGKGEIIDQSKTVNAAYALASGESLASPSVLKGVISSVDTAYSEEYKNITVTIIVDGLTDKPIQCFRLKGDGAAELKVGDEIAVYGTIKNYKDTVEFDAGCVLVPAQDIAQIKTVITAFSLAEGASMSSAKTVTGKITSIDTAYSEEYKNITVTIVVNGLTDNAIQCFRLKGDGAADLAVDDVITVTGTIKNYKGTVEFDAGCTFTK